MYKEELEAIITSDNGWLAWSTLTLAIGIIGEYALLPFFSEDSNPSLLRNLYKSLRPTALTVVVKRWHTALKLLFAFMVVAGICGEYGFSSRIAEFGSKLQRLADEDLTAATTVATSAVLEASATARENGRLRQRAANLEREAAAFRRQAASLMNDVATANAMADEARSMARSAELARAELEERIAPRTLTLVQREYGGAILSRFARRFLTRRVRMHWQPNDLEAAVLGVEIRDMLLRADISVETDNGTILGGNTGYGVRITGTGRESAFIKTLTWVLSAELASAISAEWNPRFIGRPVSIEVATKPPLGLDTLGQMLPVPPEPQ